MLALDYGAFWLAQGQHRPGKVHTGNWLGMLNLHQKNSSGYAMWVLRKKSANYSRNQLVKWGVLFFFWKKTYSISSKSRTGSNSFPKSNHSQSHNHIWTKESLKTSNIRYVTVHKKWKFCRAVLLSPILALHGIYFVILHYNKYWTRESMQKGKFIFKYHVSSYVYCYIFAVNLLFLSFKKKKEKGRTWSFFSFFRYIIYSVVVQFLHNTLFLNNFWR